MVIRDDTTREARGRKIAKLKNSIIQVDDTKYRIKSQSSNSYYDVEKTETGWRCNCPDHQKLGVKCKHIHALNYHLEIQNETSQGAVPEKKRLTYSQEWNPYNEAQKAEINLFDIFLKDLLKQVPEPEQTIGRPRLLFRDSIYCATLKEYFQVPCRRAYSLYYNAAQRGQIDHAPHFNMSSKLFNNPNLKPILQRLIYLSALTMAGLETDFAVDSTVFTTTTLVYNDVTKTKEHISVKGHLCIGVKTGIVTVIEVTDGNAGDSPQFSPLIKQTAKGFTIKEVYADKGYLSRDSINLVNSLGGTPYIPPKKNSTLRDDDSIIWIDRYHCFHLNTDEFLEHYNKRNNVESTNSAVKRKLGDTLKSRNFVAQVNELLTKVLSYNITVIIREMYIRKIKPYFLN